MRHIKIWDVRPRLLCDAHLLREHRDIHNLYAVLKRRYLSGVPLTTALEPEVIRWTGRLPALVLLHEMVVEEMRRRNWSTGHYHRTPLPQATLHDGCIVQTRKLTSVADQLESLLAKPCRCKHIFTVVEGHAKLLK